MSFRLESSDCHLPYAVECAFEEGGCSIHSGPDYFGVKASPSQEEYSCNGFIHRVGLV